MLVSKIKTNPNNPRLIKDERFAKLVQSIKDFPAMMELRPIVVNRDNMVLGGNMRLKAIQSLGMKEIPDTWVKQAANLTEEEARRFIIADNVGFGEHDWEVLANEWDMKELEDWGLDIPNFDVNNLEAEEDDFEVPDGGIETDIVLGDLFEIGEHRLLCGDSTCSDTVAKLMNGEKADMVFTDPPYGIDWNTDYTRFKGGLIPSENKYSKIQNDEKDFDPSFFLAMFDKCLFFGANCFSDKLPKGNWIIWDKRFENDKAFLADAEVAWYNGSGAVYIIKETHQGFVSSDKKRFHPTQKPVKLIEQIFEKIKAPLFLFDPFLGSGSTMVASHQLKRKCYGMELDEKYCQVIVDRMIKLDSTLEVKRNGLKYVKTGEKQVSNVIS
ncbi:MAG: DNA methyltransferase [Pseudomonadota bacterium]